MEAESDICIERIDGRGLSGGGLASKGDVGLSGVRTPVAPRDGEAGVEAPVLAEAD